MEAASETDDQSSDQQTDEIQDDQMEAADTVTDKGPEDVQSSEVNTSGGGAESGRRASSGATEVGGGATEQRPRPSSQHEEAGQLPGVKVTKGNHHCQFCSKDFATKPSLQRHIQSIHNKDTFPCDNCDKEFTQKGHLTRHHQHVHAGSSKSTPAASKRSHPGGQQKDGSARKQSLMERQARPLEDYQPHLKKAKSSCQDVTGVAEDTNQGEEKEMDGFIPDDPLEYPDEAHDGVDADMQEIVRQHWSDIRTERKVGRPVQDVYNVRLTGGVSPTPRQIDGHLWAIFKSLKCRCKMNVSYALVLRHSETGELRYFHPSQNNARFFESPILVTRREHMKELIEKIHDGDALDFGQKQRPDTKWSVACVTNMAIYINKMPDFPIGCTDSELPSFIKNNSGLVSLDGSRQTGKLYDDNLCFFRCLACHNGHNPKALERPTNKFFKKYCRFRGDNRDFAGVTESELPELETIFGVNIMVYSLVEKSNDAGQPTDEELFSDSDDEKEDEEGETERSDVDETKTEGARGGGGDSTKGDEPVNTFPELVYRSHGRNETTMFLNLHKGHFSYIKDFPMYSKMFCCEKSKCGRAFRKKSNLERHEKTCNATTSYKFPGGVYTTKPSIFEKLEDVGIAVNKERRSFPFWATFDFESYFPPMPEETRKTHGKMHLESKHVPLSFSVCSNVPGYQKPKCHITTGNTQELVENMVVYLMKISKKSYKSARKIYGDVFSKIDAEIGKMSKNREPEQKTSKGSKQDPLIKLKQEFEKYLKELPVLGFNSSKYDIKLVKQHLYTSLQKQEEPIRKVIKAKSSYMTIKTDHLKFLDITNYLAAGCSYAGFLKAYGCQERKGFFPFKWMDSLEKLDHRNLPPIDEFYDELKQASLPEEDYESCKEAWRTNQMETMRDFLTWYNNKDVVPFLEALEKMAAFYKEKNIDMFKDGISVPGLTLRYLFQGLDDGDFFTLIDKKNEDLYTILQENTVGGPAIVFHRYHEKGKTTIRGPGGKRCQKVIGYDANALYLWCLMQEMPVGPFIRRQAQDHFKPVMSHSLMCRSVEWMEWVSHKNGFRIQHKFNGKEKRVGRRKVDGYCEEKNTVYEFYGCYWHGHECELNRKKFNETLKRPMSELREDTKSRSKFIKERLNCSVVEMTECEWEKEKRSNQELKRFLESRYLPLQKKQKLSEEQIIQAIKEDQMFGLVECDIHVPDDLKPHFTEMPPIFKNVDIAKDDIGDHMRDYAERENLLTKPRRSLIGSMFGDKIMLITPLLKWYLEKGLQIKKIYQVVQYKGSACFRKFGEEVSDARREGDTDPSKSVKADTMKLIGNSAYGKTITKKENYKDVKVFTTELDASHCVNDQHFHALHDLGGNVYVAELSKRTITVDLPRQIGFFVYQYAKLKMLQFYYDFLDKFIDRADFQLCQMDTDSAYIAISGDDLTSVVKQDMRDIYEQEKHQWFPRSEKESYDKRTPGLFKVEWEGDGIVALCSKTYICFGPTDKISSKGLNKKQNELTKEKYLDVLKSKEIGKGKNIGFRTHNNEMFTYSQVKGALSYLYIKRKVADDGVTTTYLDI